MVEKSYNSSCDDLGGLFSSCKPHENQWNFGLKLCAPWSAPTAGCPADRGRMQLNRLAHFFFVCKWKFYENFDRWWCGRHFFGRVAVCVYQSTAAKDQKNAEEDSHGSGRGSLINCRNNSRMEMKPAPHTEQKSAEWQMEDGLSAASISNGERVKQQKERRKQKCVSSWIPQRRR